MTGCAADADDLVQEAFTRALTRPPEDLDRALGPWLTTVTLNLARDHLRRRKRRGYDGPWLPSPVEVAAEAAWLRPVEGSRASSLPPEGRYDLLESATHAFLLALEALKPTQRAVLLLRDVLDHSVKETADHLAISEANVKTTLHRARKQMADYDRARCRPDAALVAAHAAALAKLTAALSAGDLDALRALFSEDARALQDTDGQFVAAHRVVVGADRVARLLRGILHKTPLPDRVGLCFVNGLPALLGTATPRRVNTAPRYLFRVELDPQGRICELHTQMNPRKLTAAPF